MFRGQAPNPRRVRICLAEKGVDLPETRIDMMKREHKSEDFRARNPLGQIPTLELDDGTCISETVSICRYFEEIHPEPRMFGRTAVEKALVDQWVRRVEFVAMIPAGNFGRPAPVVYRILMLPTNRGGVVSGVTWYSTQK